MSTLSELSQAVESGKRKDATEITRALVDGGLAPLDIVEQGLVPGMSALGEKVKNNEVFVPEMLIAARARAAWRSARCRATSTTSARISSQ